MMLNEDNKELINAISFVQSGTSRTKVIKAIAKETKMPKHLYYDLNKIKSSQISATLTELKNANIVVCINEEKRKGRLYQLTELGLEVLEYLEKDDA